MRNTPKAVVAKHPNGAAVRFDGDALKAGADIGRYLAGTWMADVRLGAVERLTVNGMEAATATARARTQAGPRDLRAVVIRFDGERVYRFLILTPPAETAAMSERLRRMTHSFRPLSERETRNLVPRRVRVHEVKPGETVESLAAAMPFEEFRVERFRVLNGLKPSETLEPGRLVKLIGL